MRKIKINYVAAPLFFFLMLLDAHLTNMLLAWSQANYFWTTQLLIVTMLFASNVLSKRYMIISAVVIGSLFDIYFLGLLGIYAVAVPLVVWFMYLMKETIHQNILTRFFAMIILLTLYNSIVAMIQVLFNLASINIFFFIARFLGPTLLINIGLFFVLYYPLKKLFEKK